MFGKVHTKQLWLSVFWNRNSLTWYVQGLSIELRQRNYLCHFLSLCLLPGQLNLFPRCWQKCAEIKATLWEREAADMPRTVFGSSSRGQNPGAQVPPRFKENQPVGCVRAVISSQVLHLPSAFKSKASRKKYCIIHQTHICFV